MTISAKVKRAYKELRSFAGEKHPLEPLAAWGRHERAMRLKFEFDYYHDMGCNGDCVDPRHNWTDAKWEEEVEKELSKN